MYLSLTNLSIHGVTDYIRTYFLGGESDELLAKSLSEFIFKSPISEFRSIHLFSPFNEHRSVMVGFIHHPIHPSQLHLVYAECYGTIIDLTQKYSLAELELISKLKSDGSI